jgi:hypothetical protein
MACERHGKEARDPFIHAAAIDAGPKMTSFDLARPFRSADSYQRQVRVGFGAQSSADASFDGRNSKPLPVCEIGLQQSATCSPP